MEPTHRRSCDPRPEMIESKIQNPKSTIHHPTSNIQHPSQSNIPPNPPPKIQHPKSNIKNPPPHFPNPKFKIQNPKSNIKNSPSYFPNQKFKIQHPKFSSPPHHDEISLHHSLHGHGHDWIHHSRESLLVDREFYLLPHFLVKVADL